MLERERFSAKTLGKILFHFQNDWSGDGPAGQFWQMESALSSFNICPFHRSELGIGWRRNSYSNSCQVPKESANHIIERRNYICPLLRRHSEIMHVKARITHVRPTTGSSTCEDGDKTCTQFFVKTSFDLIMPTSRSNENLQRGCQLNSSFSKILYYTHVLRLLFACF